MLKYGGGFTHTFYSSSNGGWIEAGHEVFSGISKSYEPLLEKEDPHDPVHVWSINLDKTQIDMNGKDPANPDSWWGSVSEKGNSGNYASLITTLKNELKSKAQATDVKIISIDGITLSEKTVGQRYKNITFTLSYYAKKDSAYITDEEGNIKAGTADVTITTVSLRSCVGSMIVELLHKRSGIAKEGRNRTGILCCFGPGIRTWCRYEPVRGKGNGRERAQIY